MSTRRMGFESRCAKIVLSFIGCQKAITYFFFNDPATTEIYTLSLHDALPISVTAHHCAAIGNVAPMAAVGTPRTARLIPRSEEHTSELQSHVNLVCRLLLEKKKKNSKSFFYYKKKKK